MVEVQHVFRPSDKETGQGDTIAFRLRASPFKFYHFDGELSHPGT
jgi:hypothetical protein